MLRQKHSCLPTFVYFHFSCYNSYLHIFHFPATTLAYLLTYFHFPATTLAYFPTYLFSFSCHNSRLLPYLLPFSCHNSSLFTYLFQFSCYNSCLLSYLPILIFLPQLLPTFSLTYFHFPAITLAYFPTYLSSFSS